jgi:hypothetical protein
MKPLCMMTVTAMTAMGLMAQKLETQPLDLKKVLRVETAKDHLTVIELGDQVTMVAIGNQNAFTVERRDNKVFVTPAEIGARTNLFIWTSAGRYAYELVPAQTVEQMHFAIDQAPTAIAASAPPASGSESVQKSPPLPPEMLLEAKPIFLHGARETEDRVEVTLRDLYRQRGRLYLRYSIVNHMATVYQPSRPAAWRLAGVRSPLSLIPLGERQLGERLTRSLKAGTSLPLEVLDADQISQVEAGGQGLGWLVIEEPKAAGDEVPLLKLEFAADAKGAVATVLVLRPVTGRPEVAHVRPEAQ